MVPVAKWQGTRKDDIVFNSRAVPLAGAAVRVCAMPASGGPCAPLALIYSDSNQTRSPGTAGAGTANLYTNTADKRLY